MESYSTTKWWDADTVAVVSGSNKGIGFEAARILAEQGLTVVVTSRNEDLGKEALAKIQAAAPGAKVLFHQLDIADPFSIANFAQWMKGSVGSVTILINNAGFAYKGNTFGPEEAKTTLGVNYYGTRQLTEALLPLMKPPARIVNVSSRAGLRSIVRSPELLKRLTGAATTPQLDELAEEFVSSIRAGNHMAKGWPDTMYGVSKLMLSLYTLQLAGQLKDKGVVVNAMCPGWCRTDMSSKRGTKSAAEGADTAVWLALRPPAEASTGGFWGERSAIGW
ncbi:hypothetical protein HYH03_013701 [Edaphochlamys debaryana]|uniref:Uncharacterized protein n=1 Tax=Edaphochlamys debaryana TaxID=47281 RepID=A0A835XQH8_9CHLO|nr:hypothetical protein HYH03_013701 [Edaphochlamys debaryana]|eukprot:KAG2487702.1 hypothetical protein HYH03_013701 [Edaphochlamys debaryana]